MRGENTDIVTIADALSAAQAEGLDLVEVGPDQHPPVCRILDYGRLRYFRSKQEKERRRVSRVTNKVRQVKLSPSISENDLNSKVRLVERFLNEGVKVKVEVTLKGRQRSRPERGVAVLQQVYKRVDTVSSPDGSVQVENSAVSIVLSPLENTPQKSAV